MDQHGAASFHRHLARHSASLFHSLPSLLGALAEGSLLACAEVLNQQSWPQSLCTPKQPALSPAACGAGSFCLLSRGRSLS